jgi:hypothetical protein
LDERPKRTAELAQLTLGKSIAIKRNGTSQRIKITLSRWVVLVITCSYWFLYLYL